MTNGTIKFFNTGKGFGFVTPDGGGADIFLPAATLAAAGLKAVSPGQRVSFEQGADKRGAKVVTLRLLGEPVVPSTKTGAPEQIKVYCDPTRDSAIDVLDALRAARYQLEIVDYVTTALGHEQLRRLSHLLNDAGQSLVRRHDPLFSSLQLDDRFISDEDLWTGVAEHPSLINGPVLAVAGKARVCKTVEDVQIFLGKGHAPTVPKPKTLSPRMAALIRGEPLPAPVEVEAAAPQPDPRPPETASVVPPPSNERAKPKRKIAAKPKTKTPKKKPAGKKAAKPVRKRTRGNQ